MTIAAQLVGITLLGLAGFPFYLMLESALKMRRTRPRNPYLGGLVWTVGLAGSGIGLLLAV